MDEDDEAVEEEDASRAPDFPSSPIAAPLVSPIVSNTSNTSSFTSSTRAGIFFELPASSFADESPSRDGRRIPPNPRGISTAPLFDASSFDVFFPSVHHLVQLSLVHRHHLLFARDLVPLHAERPHGLILSLRRATQSGIQERVRSHDGEVFRRVLDVWVRRPPRRRGRSPTPR